MDQPRRRYCDPWVRHIQVVCSASTGLDSVDTGAFDSRVFSFQDSEKQDGKRGVGQRRRAPLTSGHDPLLFDGQQLAKTGKKITPLTQRAKSTNFTFFLTRGGSGMRAG